jgi:stage II sporulation protein D
VKEGFNVNELPSLRRCWAESFRRSHSMENQPKITVGIMNRQAKITGRLNGNFCANESGLISGRFTGKLEGEMVVVADDSDRKIIRSPSVRLTPQKDSNFELFNVTIGNRFHWERTEDQTFMGDLILLSCNDGTMVAINEIPVEDYLKSVVSSEMSAEAPAEFLKAHAIVSRSWVLSAVSRRKRRKETSVQTMKGSQEEIVRWYDRENHALFNVCADDHCQRYHGITKIVSEQAERAVRESHGMVLTQHNKICDARYSKACGGITENFETAWGDKRIPYLTSISDSPAPYEPIETEEEASAWIYSEPEVYCNTKEKGLLEKILSDFDRETGNFFRWTIEYSRTELEEILREKSGIDFGMLKEIIPIRRGPSGRISCLRIVGSKENILVGKELEIRRWLSRSHLLSSCFIVEAEQGPRGEAKRFILRGAGWGHGVGLCQIGAAVMATQGRSAEEILKHYFRGVEIRKIY